MSSEIERYFYETSAFLNGHFELSSGLHSDKYVQCALLLQYPDIAEKLAKELASGFRGAIDVVIGPALGGVTLAYEIARALGVRGIFAERKDNVMQLRRGFSIKKGERVLVAEDVITTGGSVKEVIELLNELRADIAGIVSLVNRSPADNQFEYRYEYLLRLPLKTYKKDECPMCKEGIPCIKPGSKKK